LISKAQPALQVSIWRIDEGLRPALVVAADETSSGGETGGPSCVVACAWSSSSDAGGSGGGEGAGDSATTPALAAGPAAAVEASQPVLFYGLQRGAAEAVTTVVKRIDDRGRAEAVQVRFEWVREQGR
jgi:hypothetical protein